MRLLFLFLVFWVLLIIQVSFISNLPWPLSLAPGILSAGVYWLQHRSKNAGAWLIILFGLYWQYLQISEVSAPFFAFLAAALIASWLSRQVFANRSFYGVLGTGLATLLALRVIQGVILWMTNWRSVDDFPWRLFLVESGYQAIFMSVLLAIIYFSGFWVERRFMPRETDAKMRL